MASDTNTFFFKKSNSTLSIEEIRNLGFIAKETKTGFFEVAQYDKMESAISYREHALAKANGRKSVISSNYYSEENESKIVATLQGILKENTPPLMFFSTSSFGGSIDYLELVIYDKDGKATSIHNLKEINKKIQDLYPEFEDNGLYNNVCFSRHTADLMTKEQETSAQNIFDEVSEIEYQFWFAENFEKSLADIIIEGLNYNYGTYNRQKDHRHFIKRLVKESLGNN